VLVFGGGLAIVGASYLLLLVTISSGFELTWLYYRDLYEFSILLAPFHAFWRFGAAVLPVLLWWPS
jgi:hypothetical protein